MKPLRKLFLVLFLGLLIYGNYNGYFDEAIEYSGEVVKDFKKEENLQEIPVDCDDCISIANWNIQTFGKTKWAKEEVKGKILNVLPYYDIIFIQEIREKSGESFDELCLELNDEYDCIISSRAGRSTSKEQYGVIYRKDITVERVIDYNLDADANDFWERPPLRVDFIVDEYSFSAYNIHIKPDDVLEEFGSLERLVEKEDHKETDNVILLGDLNADGFYYDEDKNELFLDYEWVIDDSMDTTVAKSDNTYDRIIMSDNMYRDYESMGVYKNVVKEVSDHYLVWVQIDID